MLGLGHLLSIPMTYRVIRLELDWLVQKPRTIHLLIHALYSFLKYLTVSKTSLPPYFKYEGWEYWSGLTTCVVFSAFRQKKDDSNADWSCSQATLCLFCFSMTDSFVQYLGLAVSVCFIALAISVL